MVRATTVGAVLWLTVALGITAGCGDKERIPPQGGAAVATLQVVRPEVTLVRDGTSRRATWTSRVAAGERVVATSGRAWLHHDTGLRALLGARADLRVTATGVALQRGHLWVEAPVGDPQAVTVGGARISASQAGFEVVVPDKQPPRVYVARGHVEVRAGARVVQVEAGQQLTLGKRLRPTGVTLWDDWTGGLAWPAPDAPASPPGMGEIGARVPGSLGRANFPLAVRSLDVKARMDGDRVTTVVDQVFFNPASQDLEGVYRIRLPAGAMLHAFCIDRPGLGGRLVCGYVKERQQARAQYRSKVFVGSTEDPALLEWEAPGQYKAHLYPLKAGASRRVVILYSEWLTRHGAIRRWRYPMGGAGAVAPRVQEFRLEVDVQHSGATRLEAGLGASVDGHSVVLQRSDFRPRADFVLALEGGGKTGPARAYVSGKKEREGRYLMVRLAPPELRRTGAREGMDLVVVVDTSADTDPSELQLARATVAALLGHLGPDDRVAVLGADLNVQTTDGKKPQLRKVTPARVEGVLERLARQPVGGATDLGTVLTAAAGLLQQGRGGAVVYIGDGVPTVGELRARALEKRLARLARPVRLYGVAVGPEADLGLLSALAAGHGGLAQRVTSRAAAAHAALRVAAHASRPVMHRLKVDLGPLVERMFPARPVTAVAGHDLVVLGRLRGPAPREATLTGWYQGRQVKRTLRFKATRVTDGGDLRRRWATARLHELLAGGAGREEVAELGTRYDLITAHTSIYVPSAQETQQSKTVRNKINLITRKVTDELERQNRTSERRASRRRERAARGGDQAAPEPAATEKMKKEADAKDSEDQGAAHQSVTTTTAPPISAPPPPEATSRVGVRGKASAKRRRYRRARHRRTRTKAQLDGLLDTGSDRRATGGRRRFRGGGSGGGGTAANDPASDKTVSGEAPRLANKAKGNFEGRISTWHAGRGETGLRRRLDLHVYLHQAGKPHRPKRCSAASLQPLSRRRLLWRERLRRHGTANGAREVWLDALRACEAPRWQDRRTLLREILGRLGSVRAIVSFARRSRRLLRWGAWHYLRRAVYARLRTADDLRRANRLFHPGRGLDWTQVEPLLAKQKNDDARLRELLALRAVYPTDVRLSRMTLELLERLGRTTGAERICAQVAGNPYADTRLRTAVGEYWARRGQPARARRVFSEIVEFRPTDPRARRRLGDLYRAFGWYQEAYRQYQTLAVLAPHDRSVLLLMALAAAGAGRIDEALRLEQRVAASATGSGGAARWALLWSSVRLAELRDAARRKGDDLRLARLVGRTRRSGVLRYARPLRVVLTWAHPEADLELWGAHPGWRPQRAGELAPQFGIEAFAVRKPQHGTYTFEVRRVGRPSSRSLSAHLYVLWDEGGPKEKLQTFTLTVTPNTKVLRFTVTGRSAEAAR